MNKSIEFIKNRILNTNHTNNMPTKGWDKATVFNPIIYFKECFPSLESCIKDNELIVKVGNENINLVLTITYEPESDFEYFTTTVSTHDGTLLFIRQEIEEILYKLLTFTTYNKDKITDEIKKNIFNYNIKYTIGDLILHSDFGTKEINGSRMFGQTDTLVLPIKFEVNKK